MRLRLCHKRLLLHNTFGHLREAHGGPQIGVVGLLRYLPLQNCGRNTLGPIILEVALVLPQFPNHFIVENLLLLLLITVAAHNFFIFSHDAVGSPFLGDLLVFEILDFDCEIAVVLGALRPLIE